MPRKESWKHCGSVWYTCTSDSKQYCLWYLSIHLQTERVRENPRRMKSVWNQVRKFISKPNYVYKKDRNNKRCYNPTRHLRSTYNRLNAAWLLFVLPSTTVPFGQSVYLTLINSLCIRKISLYWMCIIRIHSYYVWAIRILFVIMNHDHKVKIFEMHPTIIINNGIHQHKIVLSWHWS